MMEWFIVFLLCVALAVSLSGWGYAYKSAKFNKELLGLLIKRLAELEREVEVNRALYRVMGLKELPTAKLCPHLKLVGFQQFVNDFIFRLRQTRKHYEEKFGEHSPLVNDAVKQYMKQVVEQMREEYKIEVQPFIDEVKYPRMGLFIAIAGGRCPHCTTDADVIAALEGLSELVERTKRRYG